MTEPGARQYLLPAIALLAITATACQRVRAPTVTAAGRINIALGNPSDATSDPSHRNNYLLEKRQYVLSYNDDKGEPNWVSWHLQASDIGTAYRQNDFHPEPGLPAGFQHVVPSDYTGSGYDRGHMCDSKDRTGSAEDNSETFSMANMLPQTPDLNRHVWERLESYCRTIVGYGNEVYIIAGGYGSVGTIGQENRVNVPSHCWKIVVVLPAAHSDVSEINPDARVIAVDMPNIQGIGDDRWQKYITTVRDLEQKTGCHFLSNLSAGIREALETRRDPGRATRRRDRDAENGYGY
jgi:endonuclease G, mitochondrial